jgi:hypothetical protein
MHEPHAFLHIARRAPEYGTIIRTGLARLRDEFARVAEAVGQDGTPQEVPCPGSDDTGLVSLAGAIGKPLGLTASVTPGEPGWFVVRFTRAGPV